jgi:hypothetical protein
VYIFENTNYLTDTQISQIQSRLNAEGATAIWQYAPGFLGPNGADVTRASTLTEIQPANWMDMAIQTALV